MQTFGLNGGMSWESSAVYYKWLNSIRMGEAPDESLVPKIFHNEMWEKINRVIR